MEVLAKNENIVYKNLSYKTYFFEEDNTRFHVLDFLKDFSTLYDLLRDLVTSKIGITYANTDQMRFIIYLMMGYFEKKIFIEKTKIYKEKSDSWQDEVLNMAKIILKNSKEKLFKKVKTFFQKNFKYGILEEQKDVLLNAVRLYDSRSKIIKLFENKNIKSSNYPHNAKSELILEPKEYESEKYEPEEYEAKEFEETVAGRTKLRRQKKSDKKNTVNEFNKQIVEKDKSINK